MSWFLSRPLLRGGCWRNGLAVISRRSVTSSPSVSNRTLPPPCSSPSRRPLQLHPSRGVGADPLRGPPAARTTTAIRFATLGGIKAPADAIFLSSYRCFGSECTSDRHKRNPSGNAFVRSSYERPSVSLRLSPRCFSSSTSTSSDGNIVPQDAGVSAARSAGAVASPEDGSVGIPIDFDTASKIVGNESQIAIIELEPGQILRAESGAMMYMTDGVEMNTTSGGGLSAGFKRMLTGQNFFISDYTYKGPEGTKGTVALGTDFPSKILRLNLDDCGGKVVCQKGALLCASHTVSVEMELTKNFKSGFFGGEGFVLQALTGQGDVFVKAGGTLIRRDLKEGETLRASAGCLVAFVDAEYDVQMVQGFTNVIAGGEGLFMTTFTGPGTVWLQGQPPQRMISEIARRVPSGGGIGLAVPIPGMGGGGGEGGGGGGGGGESTQG